MPLLIAVLLAFGASFLFTPLLRGFSRRIGYVDRPNERSSHSVPTPRTGGYGIIAGAAAAVSTAGALRDRGVATMLGGILALMILAAVDDFRTMPRFGRFVAQFVIAGIVIAISGTQLRALELPGGWVVAPFGIVAFAISLVWVVGLINEYNFMDGLNGLAAGEAIVCGAAMAILFARKGDAAGAALGASLAGAAAGFLPWNIRGSIFMGDIGSVSLGFAYALLALRLASDDVPFLGAILPLVPFLFDATFTILRRASRGEAFFSTPHRTHLYQLLNRGGWSHPAVSGLWILLAIICAGFALAYPAATETLRVTMWVAVAIMHGVLCVAIIRSRRAMLA